MENLKNAFIIRNNQVIGSPSVDFEELTLEQYKEMEANGEIDLNKKYLVKADESGTLLSATDIAYDSDKTVKNKIDELDNEVGKQPLPLIYESATLANANNLIYKLSNVGYLVSGGSNAYNLNLLLATRSGEEVELIGGKNDASWKCFVIRNFDFATKIIGVYQDGVDIYVKLATYANYFRVYHKSGVLRNDFSVTEVSSIPSTATQLNITEVVTRSDINTALNTPRYTGLIGGNATVDTGWSLEQKESRKFGRLLQLDGHEGQGALSYSFIVFVKANFNNPTKVICKQIVGMYEDYDMEYTRFFELGISDNKTLTIKNKSAVQTSYKFI